MTRTGACLLSAGLLPVFRPSRRYAAVKTSASFAANGLLVKNNNVEYKTKELKDYFVESKDMIKADGGPPRWFSPLETGSHSHDSPLLLYLPGIDGTGLGLIRQHQLLGKIFDIWCLHIPVNDRTSFIGLVKRVERTIRSESYRSPSRPIYIVGESLGACIALAAASCNPDVDLSLILANPATSFSKSILQPLLPLLEVLSNQVYPRVHEILSLMTDRMVKGLCLQQIVGDISQDFIASSFYLSVVTDILPEETLIWKLQMLETASTFVNSRLNTIEAQALILSSGRDQLLPSQEEGVRLCHTLPKCEIRSILDSGHFLFLEDGIDLVSIIKGTYFYRRGKYLNHVSDYMPITPSEFNRFYPPYRFYEDITSPVMLSTLENGMIVRGLQGIPSEGPVLVVGYHMLHGMEIIPIICQFYVQRKMILRGMALPGLFERLRSKELADASLFDIFRIMGAVPASASNLYKLLSAKSHILHYPGGLREALHRKDEKYKLSWPDQSEFVRMAARFGAKIVPFGVVGEDDVVEVLFDCKDPTKNPFLKPVAKDLTSTDANENRKDPTENPFLKPVAKDLTRTDANEEMATEDISFPVFLPKIPGRFYYYFGKPIETEGRMQELRDKEKAHELYLQVQAEVEKCLAFLKEKRENDPYRNIFPRLVYQAIHCFTSEVPTFEL
ncbi:hypothetical protein Ddye_004634 [Dipteronia dyeriana]|uniref:Serine aminopeptidase S33 domain-containing protein n=1 Tax=Dipteronia dyeriana TaxID=168575 RepID=A0AAD9XV68_9ROSI|nr:hypothetical protein Ddye_004634 [Dipteronia dyeriana]